MRQVPSPMCNLARGTVEPRTHGQHIKTMERKHESHDDPTDATRRRGVRHPHFRRLRSGASSKERNSGRSEMGIHHAGQNHEPRLRQPVVVEYKWHRTIVIDRGANLSTEDTARSINSTTRSCRRMIWTR